jgi:L,D-transpeptidase YcbB
VFSRTALLLLFLASIIFSYSCKSKHVKLKKGKDIVEKPAEMNKQVSMNIKDILDYAVDNGGKIDDSTRLVSYKTVSSFYDSLNYQNIWNKEGHWLPIGDSLYNFIEYSNYYGLFPSDYHFLVIRSLKNKIAADSIARKDAIMWTKMDLLLTDSYMQLVQHIKLGRLGRDSLYPKADSVVSPSFAINTLRTMLLKTRNLRGSLDSLEPKVRGYDSIKLALPFFLDSIDRRNYTTITYPWKDSIAMIKQLAKRLREENFLKVKDSIPDSVTLSKAVAKAQKVKGMLSVDGKIYPSLIKRLNMRWTDYLKKIAMNMDRYKRFPAKMPDKYVWVNLPGFYMRVYDHDTVALESKVVCGKPTTPTPLLNSSIYNMVTYPQWTIPASIIKKEVLPGLKESPGYLKRKGYSLIDSKGNEVDPWKIKWKKYHDDIPWKVVQGSGDDNALGVYKFNFYNPFDVYLHDTNQRYFFKNKVRALSHGCVRVQEWEKLATYITSNDSSVSKRMSYNMDSIHNWLSHKVKKEIYVKDRLPVFIRYITTDAVNGKMVFYDDMYGLDKITSDKYFAGK